MSHETSPRLAPMASVVANQAVPGVRQVVQEAARGECFLFAGVLLDVR